GVTPGSQPAKLNPAPPWTSPRWLPTSSVPSTEIESLATSTSGFEPVARTFAPAMMEILVPASTQYLSAPDVLIATSIATHIEPPVSTDDESDICPIGALCKQTVRNAPPRHWRHWPSIQVSPIGHWPAGQLVCS